MHRNKKAQAFGNLTRLKILYCLREESKDVTSLIDTCGLAQSAVSQHLNKLREAGLVNTSREGKHVFYSLQHPEAGDIAKSIISLFERTEE